MQQEQFHTESFSHKSLNLNWAKKLTAIQKVLRKQGALKDRLQIVLEIIGEELLADRCYLFQNIETEASTLMMRQYVFWNKNDQVVDITEFANASIPYTHFPGLEQTFQKGNHFQAIASEIQDSSLRSTMEGRDVMSVLFYPIKSGEELWGFIGLEECNFNKSFSEEEVSFIDSVAAFIDLTLESEQLKSKLEKRDKQLEIAIESSHDGFWYINLTTNKMYLSKQWKAMLGYEEDELDSSFEIFESLLHPEDRALVLQALDPFNRLNHGTFEYEYRIRNKAGSYTWVLTQAYVKKDTNGNPISLVGTNIDISSRINYKHHIEQKEEEYSTIVNSVHEIIFQIDQNEHFTFLNRAWADITGFEVEECMGTHIRDYIFPDDRKQAFENLPAHGNPNTRENLSFEIRFISASSGSLWFKVHVSVEYNSNGLLSNAFGTIIDINQRKLAEIAQRETEERFRLMSETMSDLICMHKPDGTMTYVSPSIREMLGFSPSDFLDHSPYEFIHKEDKTRIYNEIHDPVIKGKASKCIGTLRMRKADGSYLWLETITQSIKSGNKIESMLSTSRDISKRVQAEREMKKALEKEKELNELRSRFVSMASHEFRTPLTSIKSSVQLLEMYAEEVDNKMNAPFMKHFQRIVEQIDRLSALMNDILIMGKTEADKMPLSIEPTNPSMVIQEVIDMHYSPFEDGRNTEFNVIGEPFEVELDTGLMSHVVSNTLSNAFKYSLNKPAPQLTLSFCGDLIKIAIQDFGIGIPKEEQSQLFQSFFRAENTSTIEGTGLGLVIVKQFVELHAGSIDVSSEEHQGTLVTITIPRKHT